MNMNRDMTEIVITIIVCVTILCMCIGSNYFDYKQQKLRIDEEQKIQERKILLKSKDTRSDFEKLVK